MDKEEILRLEAYIREKLHPGLRLLPGGRKTDPADVYLGAEALALILIDDEDGERTYQFEMKFARDDGKIEAYLKEKINPGLRVVARGKNTDSAEVYLGEEFLAIVYTDEDKGKVSYQFQMSILREDIMGE
jgi:hypothetical protein